MEEKKYKTRKNYQDWYTTAERKMIKKIIESAYKESQLMEDKI